MSKREIRHLMGLPNHDYRYKTYSVESTVEAIVKLGERVSVVGNRMIYETVTGLRNYSKKRWESLKLILIVIAIKREFEVNSVKYTLQQYTPMRISRFNFYLLSERDLRIRNAVAGFTVFKAKDNN